MKKEIEFEINPDLHGSYRPVITYYDDNNNVIDKIISTWQGISDQLTEDDLNEFKSMVKQSLLDDIENIYEINPFNNAEIAFIKHRINYESFLYIKRLFVEQEN